MAKFEPVVQWLLYQEDDHRNPGRILNLGDGAGLTRLGVTQKSYGSIVPPEFFSTMPFHDAVQVAKSLYVNQYWHHLNGDRILSEEVAAPLLSFAVNRNIPTSVEHLQKVLGVDQDGVLGLVTIAQLNQKDPAIVAKMFRAEWENYYRHVAAVNPNDVKFINGWVARANFPYPSPLVPNIYV
jgi:lysozyme family protein